MLKGWCAVCYAPTNMRCQQCKAVSYCSRECQKASYAEHKPLCSTFKSGRFLMTDWMVDTMKKIHNSTRDEKICVFVTAPGTLSEGWKTEGFGQKLRVAGQLKILDQRENEGLKVMFTTVVVCEENTENCQDFKAFKHFMKLKKKVQGVHYWMFPLDIEAQLEVWKQKSVYELQRYDCKTGAVNPEDARRAAELFLARGGWQCMLDMIAPPDKWSKGPTVASSAQIDD